MKKIFMFVLATILGFVSVYSIPANPKSERLLQPDGTYITVRLVGDEYMHYSTTDDGYTIIKSSAGYYMYAELADGKLIASQYIAHDKSLRSKEENAYLLTIGKDIKPEMTAAGTSMRGIMKAMTSSPLRLHGNDKYDMSKFRGLIILVEFNDCSFSRSDIHEVVNDMVNKKDYDGYMTTAMIPEKVECTGSVRDYYYDNSMGMFEPQFDIVGPVKIDYSKYDAGGSGNGPVIAASACKAADDVVDFSNYDGDGDGKADMVYFIFAGYGANYSGNNANLLWPHASKMFGLRLDGVSLERYACSTEMYGKEGSGVLDGIGTICHEFSHVLGLPDEYDTDYASSGGQSVHPASWSIMASGSYKNKSRTPVGYTLYERYALGFANPQLIESTGKFTLDALNISNSGYRVNTSIPNEFFLIENRQQTRWDAYLAGHGMIVTRVDSTNVDVWENNQINCNPSHCYLELLRANPQTKTSGKTTSVTDSDGDPFPGSGKITEITNETTPSLRSWTHASTPLEIKNIEETEDGIISFDVDKAKILMATENFESMDLTDGSKTVVKGMFCDWKLTGGSLITKPAGKYGNGERVLSLKKKAEVETTPIEKKVTSVSFMSYNTSSSMNILRCYYSVDNGKTWVAMKNVDGIDNVTVSAGDSIQVIYNIEVENPCFKLTETVGSNSAYCNIDDFTISYDGETSSIISNTRIGSKALGIFALNGNMLTINTGNEHSRVAVYDANGMLVSQPIVSSAGVAIALLHSHGVYIISVDGKRYKMAY